MLLLMVPRCLAHHGVVSWGQKRRHAGFYKDAAAERAHAGRTTAKGALLVLLLLQLALLLLLLSSLMLLLLQLLLLLLLLLLSMMMRGELRLG